MPIDILSRKRGIVNCSLRVKLMSSMAMAPLFSISGILVLILSGIVGSRED